MIMRIYAGIHQYAGSIIIYTKRYRDNYTNICRDTFNIHVVLYTKRY